MAFKLTPPATDWFSQYDWLQIPQKELDHLVATKENVTKKSNLKNTKLPRDQAAPQPKHVIIQEENEGDAAEAHRNEFEAMKQAEVDRRQSEQEELMKAQQEGLERTEEQIDQLKLAYDMTLQSKHISQKAEVTLYQDEEFYDPNKSQRRNCEKFILKPEPILALDRILGVQPRHFCGQAYFNRDLKLASEILYTQANCIVGFHHQTQKQRLLLDCRVSEIMNLWSARGWLISLSETPNGKLLKSGAPATDQLLAFWDTDAGDVIFTFKPPFALVKTCSVSTDQSAMAISGKDLQGRDLVIVYSFQDMVKYQKIELLARQLADFDLLSLKFLPGSACTLIGCGRQNIRIFKLKNNFLPSQLVALNNLAREKVFNNSAAILNEHKKVKQVYVTTECGCLFLINFYSRQVDRIIQLHEGPSDEGACLVQCLISATSGDSPFQISASRSGVLKLWSIDFGRLISEVALNQEISAVDLNIDQNKISVMSRDGTLSLLELENSSFKVLMRSHQDEIVGVCHSAFSSTFVSVGRDSAIKVWDAENLDQVHEFTTALTDPPTKIVASTYDDTVAVGFKSGFLRLFQLSGAEKSMTHETMIFESPVMDIAFSRDGKFLAAFHRSARIVIFNTEQGGFAPVKNIDYDYPNSDFFSLDFSPCGSYLANISSNANTITIWETKNFSLRWHVDLTGDILTKIVFAPNGKDLLAMTTTSKLKYLRVDPLNPEVEAVRDQHALTDMQCQDFLISPNNKFIVATGKDGHIKVYDYFMRGEVTAAQQAFMGHLTYAKSICWQQDMRYIITIGPGNGLYRWSFLGDKKMPDDIMALFEKTQKEIKREEVKEQQEIILPTFDQKELQTYTEQELSKMREAMMTTRDVNQTAPLTQQQISRPHQELLQDGGISLKRQPKIEYTPSGYTFEEHEIALQKVLGCSVRPRVGNNIAWDRRNRCLIYSMQNVLIIEELNQEKTQVLKHEVNDLIHGISLSADSNLLMAYTRVGTLDGRPQIIVWSTKTRRKVSQVAIDDEMIQCVQFSNYSNMILVVSYSTSAARSTIQIWDFNDGRQDFFSKSVVPFQVLDARWNPYLKSENDEFITIAPDCYHYWRVTENLQMQYQQGTQPKQFEGSLTTLSFVEPMHEQNSVFALIGLSTGHIWVLDTRGNYWLHSTKVLEGPVNKITSSVSRIVVEGASDQQVHAWELKKTIADFDYDASNPDYFFAGKEKIVTLDGAPSASSYDATAAEAIFVSQNNSFWLVNFIEVASVKIKSCHQPTAGLQAVDFKYVSPGQFSPENVTQDQEYTFDQNYLVGSSGNDGVVKLWSLFDLDHRLNFTAPKEECLAIAMHQFKPFMVCAFTDGYLRFFDIEEGRNLGRCLVNQTSEEQPEVRDYVIQLRILPSGSHLLCVTKYGQVLLIFVETWTPLGITICSLASLNTSLNAFDVSFLEPYNKWLAATCNGKILVYNRQDSNSFRQELFDQRSPPQFIFMDSFNAQEYVDNCFTETKRVNTLDHFYSLSKRNLVFNEACTENETEAVFLNNDLASYICFVRKCNALLIRNFELHQIVKKIDFESRAINMQLSPGSAPYIFLVLESNELWMIDFVNEGNLTKVKTLHDHLSSLKVCPNGRYVLTSGINGDIAVWSVKRKRSAQGQQIARESFV